MCWSQTMTILLIVFCAGMYFALGVFFSLYILFNSRNNSLVFFICKTILYILLNIGIVYAVDSIQRALEYKYGWLWFVVFVIGILLPNLKYPPKKDKKE
jgi:hypothetical protein